MKVCIFMGSPRVKGNTATLLKPFVDELQSQGADTEIMVLAGKNIAACKGCYKCQNVQDTYGCVQKDDMQEAVEMIVSSDLIVLATPIYTWYCTGIMKNLLDRHYGLNKYYGEAKGSLWAGKSIAILATHGYDRDYACTPFETGIKHLCEHSHLNYLGLYSARDNDETGFVLNDEIEDGVRKYAKSLVTLLQRSTLK